jgi:hypothetical protein
VGSHRHVKGVSGSSPLDPVGGVKFIQVTLKMNPLEATMAGLLAKQRGLTRSELIRQLIKKEMDASAEAFLTPRSKAEKRARAKKRRK